MADLWKPPRTLPSSSPLLEPNLALLDQWIRLNIGYIAGTAISAPVLRSVILQIGEREHLRQHHLSRDSHASPPRYTSSIASFRDVLREEGWRGLYRGSGILFSSIPIRASFHMLLFNLVEQQTLTLDSSTFFTKLAHPFDPRNEAPRPRSGDESDQLNEPLHRPSPPIFLNESSTHSQYRTSGQRKRSYLTQFTWLMAIGELIIYPTQYLFVTMAGDMVGNDRAIATNRTTTLLLDVLKRDGLWGLYRGFFPSFLAVTLPALLYANIRFEYFEEKAKKEREVHEQEEKERKRGFLSTDKNASSGAGWPLSNDERVDRLPEEPESDMSRRLKEIGAVPREGETFSFRYTLLCAVVYPLFVSSARMVIGHADRTPNVELWSFLSPESWPKVRFFLAQVLPMTSVSHRESFLFTFNRVVSSGSSHTFAGIWAVVAATAAASLLSSSVSLLSSLPLTSYLNHVYFGSPTIESPDYILDMQEHKSLVAQYQEDASYRVLISLSNFDNHPDESTSSHESASESRNRGHNLNSITSSQIGSNVTSTSYEPTQVDLYADSDDLLEKLGLQTRGTSKSQTASSVAPTPSSLDSLNASLASNNTLTKKSLDGARKVPSELAGFDLEKESLLPPSARSSSNRPSKQPPPTEKPAHQEKKPTPPPATPKNIPLLSQRKKLSQPPPTSL